jgi:hypothetical protein
MAREWLKNRLKRNGYVQDEGQTREDVQERISNYERRFRTAGEEVPPPRQEGNLFTKALDIIDRPGSAVRGAVHSLQQGKGFSEAASAAVRGFRGEERVSGQDILRHSAEHGSELARDVLKTKPGRFIGSLATEIVLDPTTYLTFGTVGTAKGLGQTYLKFAGKEIANVTPIARGIGKAVEKTGLPEIVGPVLSPKYIRKSVTSAEEMPNIERARDVIRAAPRETKGGQQIALGEMAERFGKANLPQGAWEEAAMIREAPTRLALRQERINKALDSRKKWTTEKKGRSGYMAAETFYPNAQNMDMFEAAGKLGMNVTEEGARAARLANEVSEETTLKDIAAGVEFGQLPNYLRHLYNDPPERVLTVLNQWQKQAAKLSPKAGFQKSRSVPTIAEAEKMGLHPVKDVRVLTAVREMEGIRQRSINTMYDALNKIPGISVSADKAPVGWVKLPVKQLEDKAVHPEVARFLQRLNDSFDTDEGMRHMMSYIREAQNIWKGLVTAPNPMFHVRNAMGNAFNNFLAGVVNPNTYALAARIQKGSDDIIELGGTRYTGQQLRAVFRQLGLEGFGFFHGEAPRRMAEEAREAFTQRSALQKVGKAARNPVQTGRDVGDAIETNAKLAHFIDRLAKGDTPEVAAQSVRKFLFDYGDLTTAEQKIKGFVPFYTWARKNLPLQLEMLVKQPGKFAALEKARQTGEQTSGAQGSPRPEWLDSEAAVPMIRTPDGNVIYLRMDLPATNLNMIGSPAYTARAALGMLTPFAKVPVEVAMNKQIFSGAPIEKYPGAMTQYGNIQVPAYVGYGLSQLGAVPRAAADIIGTATGQEERMGYLPPQPRQLPVIGSMIRTVNPEREAMQQELTRERQLGEHRRYLEEVQGKDIPTITEMWGQVQNEWLKRRLKSRGLL